MRLSNAQLVPDKITRLMNPRDRAAFGILIPEERRRKVEATAENELQKLCEQELFRHEIEFLHLSPRAREKKGWPDLTFVLSGMPMAVELKTVTGRLSPDQERVLSRMQANGWQTYVVRSMSSNPFWRFNMPDYHQCRFNKRLTRRRMLAERARQRQT